MRISGHTSKYMEITIDLEEAQAMLACDEEKLNEFAGHLDKYCTWIDDCKRILTKRILEAVSAKGGEFD